MVFEDNSSPSQYEDGKKFPPDSFQENLFPVCYEDYNLHHLYSIGRLKSDWAEILVLPIVDSY